MSKRSPENEPRHDNPNHHGLASHEKEHDRSKNNLAEAGYNPDQVKGVRRAGKNKQPKPPGW